MWCDEKEASLRKDERAHFVYVLKNYSILLNRGMTTSLIKSKENAWQQFKSDFEKETDKLQDISKLKKKLNNMKTDIKKKTNKNQTGDKPIKLLPWEKDLMQLMEFEGGPVSQKIPGAVTVGLLKTDDIHIKEMATPKTKRKKIRLNSETSETEKLTTPELQRLVLLKQLELTKLQISKETILLQKLKNEEMMHHMK